MRPRVLAEIPEQTAVVARAEFCSGANPKPRLDWADRAVLAALIRRVLQARGEPAAVVQAAATRAKTASTERGAYIIARRVEELLAEMAEDSDV